MGPPVGGPIFLLTLCRYSFIYYLKDGDHQVRTNKWLLLTLVAAFASAVLATTSYCAEESGKDAFPVVRIGHVDMAVLITFHPLMQYYSFETGFFIKPLKEGLSRKELLEEVKARQEKNRVLAEKEGAEIKSHVDELASIEVEVARLLAKTSGEQNALNEKFSKEIAGIKDEAEKKSRTEKYNAELGRIDREYYENKKKHEERKVKLSQRISELQQKINEANYMDTKESRKIFYDIINEINEAVAEVAKGEKIQAVFNSSFVSPLSVFEANKADYYARAQEYSKWTGELPIPNFGFLSEEVDEADIAGSGTGENSLKVTAAKNNCEAIYSKRAEFVKLFETREIFNPANQMMVYGGEDLTVKVLGKLFNKHSVPKAKIKLITDVLTQSKLVNRQVLEAMEKEHMK